MKLVKIFQEIEVQVNSIKDLEKSLPHASETLPKNRIETLPNSFYEAIIIQKSKIA